MQVVRGSLPAVLLGGGLGVGFLVLSWQRGVCVFWGGGKGGEGGGCPAWFCLSCY